MFIFTLYRSVVHYFVQFFVSSIVIQVWPKLTFFCLADIAPTNMVIGPKIPMFIISKANIGDRDHV